MTNLGAVLLPYLPPERLCAVVRAADDAGLEQLWLWEDCFLEGGIASAAAALAWTERLQVGVGLLPVPLRNVALTAMELATLHRMFPGRLHAAVGHGVQDWMGQVGARVSSPMTLLREYVVALRLLLAGERVTTDGRYVHLDDVALDWPPAAPPAVLIGATGPKSLRLAGEVGDGTILTGGTSPARLQRARAAAEEGRAAAGRDGHHRVVMYLDAATGPDAAERLEAERQRRNQASLDDVGVAGDAAAVAAATARWFEAGADTVVLSPLPDDPDPAGFVRFVAEQVRPLVG